MFQFLSIFVLAICLSFFTNTQAYASKEQGRAIAEKLCARCHAVGLVGESPLKKAPPFRSFAQKWPLEYLEESLAEGIVTAHEAMPQFQFEASEVGALIRYLHSLQKGEK